MRRNLVPNPSFEVNISDSWTEYITSGAVTHSRATDESRFGVAAYKIVATEVSDAGLTYNIPVLLAGTYTFSVYIKTGADVTNAHAVVRDDSDFSAYVNGHLTTADTDWTRISGTFTIASTQGVDILLGFGSYGAASTGTAWFDGVMLEQGPLGSYFDGSLPPAQWEGTPHNSISVLRELSGGGGVQGIANLQNLQRL